MKTIEILSVTEANKILEWCKNQQLEEEIFTGKITCRQKKWWGREAEFHFNQSHVYERDPIESDRLLESLRDRFKPEADSALLYYYETKGSIGEHLDKQCFNQWVTLINLVDSDKDLFGNRPTTRFRWNRRNYELNHGEVIEFNSRIIHSVPPLRTARYSLQLRQIAD